MGVDEPPLDEKALETRRAELVAVFQARMGRWQPVQAAGFAVASVGLAGYLSGPLLLPHFTVVLVVSSCAIAASAGAQAALEGQFRADMRAVERHLERLMRGRTNL